MSNKSIRIRVSEDVRKLFKKYQWHLQEETEYQPSNDTALMELIKETDWYQNLSSKQE